MELTVLTADSAQVDQAGKVHALGLAWSWIVTPTPPMALVVLVQLDRALDHPTRIEITGALVDEDEKLATFGEGTSIEFHIVMEVGEGINRAAAAMNFSAGLRLPPGGYSWRLSIDGEDVTERAPFRVKAGEASEVE